MNWRAFLDGWARAFDLFGIRNKTIRVRDDREALADDWERVGDDLRKAMDACRLCGDALPHYHAWSDLEKIPPPQLWMFMSDQRVMSFARSEWVGYLQSKPPRTEVITGTPLADSPAIHGRDAG